MRAFVASAGVSLALAQSNFSLTLLDLSKHPLAQCLDGSPGGFYFQPGWGSGSSSYVIHTQGGGWCVNEQDCVARSNTPLGSSKTWGTSGCPNSNSPVCNADGGDAGMISSDPTVNPDLYNWNKVFINYCDGGSYAGTVLDPVTVGSSSIYFRGRYILDAVYDELLAVGGTYGMATAKEVVIKGTSAGGLAVYLHVDYLANRIHAVSPTTRVSGAPGAGFFLDVPSYAGNGWPWGKYAYTPIYQYVYNMQNVSGSVNADCMLAYGATGEGWKCFMAPYTLPYIKTPSFITNSLYDAWQAGNIMDIGCKPTQAGSCSAAQLNYWQSFRSWMISGLAPVLAPGSPHGGFLQSCDVHVVEDIDHSWNGVLVAGQTQAQTFGAWYYGPAARPALQPVAIDGPWNVTGAKGNPTC